MMQDMYSLYNTVGNNGPTFSSPGYNGAGACLMLTRTSSQSASVASPFLNMVNRSFTLEAWIYPNTLNSGTDYGIFGQFDAGITSRAMHIIIRNQKIYFGFFADDLTGVTTLTAGQWYHMAYVYDLPTRTQFVYVNGIVDATRTPAGPYIGTVGALTIGTTTINSPNSFFDGCLDSISYIARAKNASEILDGATLVAYLKFDGNLLLDSGPLAINGTGSSFSYVSSGRVNQGLSLTGTSSYVQITGLRRIGTNSWPYTVAIWINPTNTAGGTVMHLSSRTDGAQTNAWCLNIIGFTSGGQIAVNSWNGGNVFVTGPTAALNTWTHVAGTYSATNGLRLYVNGVLIGASATFGFSAGGVPMTITLGSSLLGQGICNTGSISAGQYRGSLDEFRVYARELTAAEIVKLANP